MSLLCPSLLHLVGCVPLRCALDSVLSQVCHLVRSSVSHVAHAAFLFTLLNCSRVSPPAPAALPAHTVQLDDRGVLWRVRK